LIDRIFFSETWNDPGYTHNINMTVPNQVVEIGSIMTTPTITSEWNSNITPNSDIITELRIRKPNQ